VAERVCDEKSGERRGDNRQIITPPVACFRKIFAAQIPPSPQRDQGGAELFKSSRTMNKVERNSSIVSSEITKGAQKTLSPSAHKHLQYFRVLLPQSPLAAVRLTTQWGWHRGSKKYI
jgi:hypothetical protein